MSEKMDFILDAHSTEYDINTTEQITSTHHAYFMGETVYELHSINSFSLCIRYCNMH